MSDVNLLAVVAAALSSFLIGGLWYSPALFGNAWNRAAGNTGKPGQGHPGKVFGVSFAFALAASLVYALVVPQQATVMAGAAQGLAIGAGLVAASFGINYQFANRGAVMWLIDGGYHTLQFGLYGLILTAWKA
jgi:hypothetical protein